MPLSCGVDLGIGFFFIRHLAMEARANVLNDRRTQLSRTKQRRRACALAALVALTSCALASCSDEVSDSRTSARTAPSPPAAHEVSWLDVGSPISPAQWIASRGEETVKPTDDVEVESIAEKLGSLHTVYRESERMIANRAVQLSGMLDSIGIDESASTVLDELLRVADGARMDEGFGAVAQHYYNLRASEVSREEALKTLKSRYGGI